MPPALTHIRTAPPRSTQHAVVLHPTRPEGRAVGVWLLLLCVMLLGMIVLGGTTRLTGSGLSIMEWAPIVGALPPLSTAEWQRLFALYQHIPQYTLLHEGMGLGGFKQIFWLEWLHRLWGRLIGLVFLGPFCVFLVQRRLSPQMLWRLAGLFLLGGLQGAVGWFMVASGFEADRTSVSPYRLVAHLSLALLLYSCLFWMALSVLRPAQGVAPERLGLARGSLALLVSVALTILAGGFVSGLHAGLIYNTFPLMDGRLFPSGYFGQTPFLANITANITAVQFDHRLMATLTAALALGLVTYGFVSNPPRMIRIALACVLATVLAQYALGIATLIYVVPVPLAATHQATAVLLLSSTLFLLHATRLSRSV